ncbi:MAG: response regulator [Actinomycetota bacterium]|nr:response regulator [Actinomycetota bacterium]
MISPGSGRQTRLVLVVDDDDMIRRLIRDVLEVDEVDVVEARNGEIALVQIERTNPALIVLDIMMPGIDGVEVCRRVDHSVVKVLVLTARDDPCLEDRCREAGANAFLTKPFSSMDLLDKVVELLPG